jgi:hypothetical protein
MNQPASAPDVMPPREIPKPDPHQRPDGNNATTSQPDPQAEQHPARDEEKGRGPYVTGNT